MITGWQECVEEEPLHLMEDRKKTARKELGTRRNLQRPAPRYLFLPATPYLLKFPQPPKRSHRFKT
jgi:hypothetical protein